MSRSHAKKLIKEHKIKIGVIGCILLVCLLVANYNKFVGYMHFRNVINRCEYQKDSVDYLREHAPDRLLEVYEKKLNCLESKTVSVFNMTRKLDNIDSDKLVPVMLKYYFVSPPSIQHNMILELKTRNRIKDLSNLLVYKDRLGRSTLMIVKTIEKLAFHECGEVKEDLDTLSLSENENISSAAKRARKNLTQLSD